MTTDIVPSRAQEAAAKKILEHRLGLSSEEPNAQDFKHADAYAKKATAHDAPPPPFGMAWNDGIPVLFADSDEDFRILCAAEAVGKSISLLEMLRREYRRRRDAHDFGNIFESTMDRALDLLNSVNIGPCDDEMVRSDEIANVVFGEEWLIGERCGGVIVPATEEARHG